MFKDTESFKKHKYCTSKATQTFSNGYVATTPQQKERQLVDDLTGTGGTFEDTNTGTQNDSIPVLYVIIIVAGVVAGLL